MVGYKSISELSLKECYDMLQNERNGALKTALEQQYQVLLPRWQERDTLTFTSCKTITEYENYLMHFDLYYYHILHGDEARDAIKRIKLQNIERESSKNSKSQIEKNEIKSGNDNSSFAEKMAWGCLWAIIAPILYIIISIICS